MKDAARGHPASKSRYALDEIIYLLKDLQLEDARYILRRLEAHIGRLELEQARPEEQGASAPAEPRRALSYRQEMVRCGKDTCKKCIDGKAGHGPYWYAYWSEGGKTRKRYIGKQLPEPAISAPES